MSITRYLPILPAPVVLTIIGCSIVTLAAKRPVGPIICCVVPPGCCCNCIIRVVVDGITLALDAVTPVTVVLRGKFAAATLAFVALVTPAADAIVGVSWGRFGARILILVVFSLVAENDFANGIGLI